MIVAEQKPFEDIYQSIKPFKKVLVLGCGTCVTVCMAGGEKEVGLLAEQIRLHERDLPEDEKHEITEATIERQCDEEFFEPVRKQIKEADAVLSMACGVGVQQIAQWFPETFVIPALNTEFFGATEEAGIWVERCAGCGTCILELTGGICPVARCSKSILNGPCGGSQDGKCEIDNELDCAWQLIFDRLKTLGRLEEYLNMIEIKDWQTSRDGGPRKVIREDARKAAIKED